MSELNDVDIPNDNNLDWAIQNARSTGGESVGLLAALYNTVNLDEISNAEDWIGVRSAIRRGGKVDESGKTTTGYAFWVYPTGLYGPFHVKEDGETELHGVFLTVEKGVEVEDAVERAKRSLRGGVMIHEHVAK